MSILFDKWKNLSSLEEALEEEQQYIEEEKEKKRTSWMDSIKKLKEDMKKHQQEMNENSLGKSQEEVECLVDKQSSLKEKVSWDSYYKEKDSPILLEDRIKQIKVEIGCLEDELYTLLQLNEEK